ncbi:MAG: SDR family oxidoreductase [Acidobacteria bacterium]|nr:SDR family oxidoreductase [Acidobacteriota bacterium]
MAGRLEGKVCLLSGSTGIAAATARLAAAEGGRVCLAALDEPSCASLAGEIGGVWVAGDLRKAETAQAAVRRCLVSFGSIDCLFNVAGVSGRRLGDGPVDECSEAGWDTTLESNAKSAFLLSREVVRLWLARAPGANRLRGSILHMASVLAFSPEPSHFATHAYAASKGAMVALTLAMASYYAPHGIRVNAIAPGLVRTPMSARAQGDAEVLAEMREKQPLADGLIDADEIARAAVFLLSDDARMITGQVLTVDAGWHVR